MRSPASRRCASRSAAACSSPRRLRRRWPIRPGSYRSATTTCAVCASRGRFLGWLRRRNHSFASFQPQEQVVAEDYSFSVVLEPQEGGGFTVLVPALPEVV